MAQRRLAKGEQTRRRVLDAVIEAVARQGFAELSVADIGRVAGMSSGHVLYYFETKDALFVEALRHVEAPLEDERAGIVTADEPVVRRLRRYLELYLPTGRSDARWSLWVQVWSTALTDPGLAAIQDELDAAWQRDLDVLVRAGVDDGSFTCADPAAARAAIAGLLDGLALRLMTSTGDGSAGDVVDLAERTCLALLG